MDPARVFVPLFTWTGFYVGVNAGWGWRNDDNEPVFLSPGIGTPGLAGTLSFPGGDDGVVELCGHAPYATS